MSKEFIFEERGIFFSRPQRAELAPISEHSAVSIEHHIGLNIGSENEAPRNITFAMCSMPGHGHSRDTCEDMFQAYGQSPLFAVFDGHGKGTNDEGIGWGRIASEATRKAFNPVFHNLRNIPEASIAKTLIETAFDAAHRAVRENIGLGSGAGVCTVALLPCFQNDQFGAIVAWLGDARAYQKSGDATRLLTFDDNPILPTLLQGVDQYAIQAALEACSDYETFHQVLIELSQRYPHSAGLPDDPDMTFTTVYQRLYENLGAQRYIEKYFRRVISDCVGELHDDDPTSDHYNHHSPHTRFVPVQPGDTFLLASDGVTDCRSTPQINAALSTEGTTSHFAHALVKSAHNATNPFYQKDDDRAALVLRFS